jgi:hypothetical protein
MKSQVLSLREAPGRWPSPAAPTFTTACVVSRRRPRDRAVPKPRPLSPRFPAIGSASRAARLVAERLPRRAFSPPSTSPSVSTPAARPKPLRSARRCHPSRSFRPRAFSAPRRLAPPGARGLVASRSRPWGSSVFGALHDMPAVAHALPSPMPTPSRAFPPAAAVRASPHVRSPLPFPAPLEGVRRRLRGLAPPGSPQRSHAVAGARPPRGSPGLPCFRPVPTEAGMPPDAAWTARRAEPCT